MLSNTRKRISILLVVLFTMALATSTALATTYVASAQSNKFHYSSCRAAKRINQSNLITFSSRDEAINAGYSPCGICHP